ncbi:MFS transporter [soil metagenome]
MLAVPWSARSPTRAPVPAIVKSLGWVSFFTDVASEMIYPLLPALLLSLGGTAVWLGVMEGLAEAASAAVKFFIGPVVDRAPRRKPLILAGYALATVVRPLIAFATMGLHVVILRSLDRIGKGVRGVPRDALVAESVPRELSATAFAYHRMMDNAGSVFGPVVAFVLLRGVGLPIRDVILLAVVPGLVSCAVLYWGVKEPSRHVVAAAAPLPVGGEPAPAVAAPLPPAVGRYLAILALFTMGASADSFLILRAVELGVAAAWAPLLWLALSGAKAASNMPGGWLADRFGKKRTLGAAWLLYAAFYAASSHVTSPVSFALLVVAYGSYYGLAEGSERALLADLTPPSMRGRAFGAMHAVTGLAVLPANLLFGLLYAKHVSLAFGVSAACAASAAALLFLTVKEPLAPPGSATLSA